MKGRCLNPNNRAYGDYGARGITICERWMEFVNFLADMGDAPEGLSLERKDNDRGYEPENCVWATASEQALNRRSNHILTVDGVSKPLKIWAEEVGLPYAVLHARVYAYGWSHERAVSTPNMGKCRAIQHGVELRETQRGGFLSGASLSKPVSSGASSPTTAPSTHAAGNLSTRPRDYLTERA